MDRIGPRLTLLILAGALAAAGDDRPLPIDFPIRDAHWLTPEGRLDALTSQPAECALPPVEARDRLSFEIGRAAFRAPLLLGGQAARAGLRCETCHSNGRRNAHFLFPGLSDAPGTADVTASIMSSHRGNGRFDPRPIPDLASSFRISRDPRSTALERFIRGLIVEEFDGAEPPTRILDGLASYVRAIDSAHCPAAPQSPILLALTMDDTRRAIAAAGEAWQLGDGPSARLLLSAARSTLGRVHERFSGAALARKRQDLRNADAELFRVMQAIDRGDRDIAPRIATCLASLPALAKNLGRSERQSLFNADQLRAALDSAGRSQAVPLR